jgi:DNA-binding transcriptional MerR regulator
MAQSKLWPTLRGDGVTPSLPRKPAHPSPVAVALDNIRKAPRRVRRQSRDAIGGAVAQLLDLALLQPDSNSSGEYRIDDLARLSGTTTRNIRAYRERGLLQPPRRVGRLALFDDSHLERLKLISSMLDRGYNITHVREMLTALEDGKELADVLGLQEALVKKWSEDEPEELSVDAVRRLAGDQHSLDRLVSLGLVSLDGDKAVAARPKLLRAFEAMRNYGMAMDKVIDVHEEVSPSIDKISRTLVDAGAQQVARRFDPAKPRGEADLTDLASMLVEFRTLAVSSVTASLAISIERTIETVVGNYLADLLEKQSEHEAG